MKTSDYRQARYYDMHLIHHSSLVKDDISILSKEDYLILINFQSITNKRLFCFIIKSGKFTLCGLLFDDNN